MEYNEVLCTLNELAGDEKFLRFSAALMPSARPLIGVRVPALRTLAKQLAKDDWKGFLTVAKDDTFEETLLQGFVIGYAKMPLEERLSQIQRFVAKIDGWAVCDCACSTFTVGRKYPQEVWDFVLPYLNSENPWEVRFAVIMLMDYFVDEQHIDNVLELLGAVNNEHYYVQMGTGWALSVCYIKFRDKTLPLLQSDIVMPQIRKMAIQKCIESFRVSAEDKVLLKELRATLKK